MLVLSDYESRKPLTLLRAPHFDELPLPSQLHDDNFTSPANIRIHICQRYVSHYRFVIAIINHEGVSPANPGPITPIVSPNTRRL